MKALVAEPLTCKTLFNLISISSKEQIEATYSLNSRQYSAPSLSLSFWLSRILSLLLWPWRFGTSVAFQLLCILRSVLPTWLKLFILLAEIYWKWLCLCALTLTSSCKAPLPFWLSPSRSVLEVKLTSSRHLLHATRRLFSSVLATRYNMEFVLNSQLLISSSFQFRVFRDFIFSIK